MKYIEMEMDEIAEKEGEIDEMEKAELDEMEDEVSLSVEF